MNPMEILSNLMQNKQANSNPVLRNAIGMAQNQDSKGLEQLARNLCKEKGIDVDQAVKQIKGQFRF